MANKIVIEPVSRVEGHGKVTVYLNDQGNVDKSYLHITQVRGFEKFCEGRLYNEMLAITPRICGICPVSHHPTKPPTLSLPVILTSNKPTFVMVAESTAPNRPI